MNFYFDPDVNYIGKHYLDADYMFDSDTHQLKLVMINRSRIKQSVKEIIASLGKPVSTVKDAAYGYVTITFKKNNLTVELETDSQQMMVNYFRVYY